MIKYRPRTGSKVVTVSTTMSRPHYSALQRYTNHKNSGGFGVHIEKALEQLPGYRSLLIEERIAEHGNNQTGNTRTKIDIIKSDIRKDFGG